MAKLPACDSVLMIGTHPRTMGGIATVVRGYMEDGLFERLPITYVSTHRDGNAAQKACTALSALIRASCVMLRSRPLVHIHLSSRASFWRKSLFCLIARLTGRPYLLHMHGSEFMKFFDEECGRFGRWAVRNVFAHASLLIALSQQWLENLRRICPSAQIEVLPNAVPIPAIATHPKAGPAQVLFVGRLGTRKGTFDLLHSFAAIAGRIEGSQLTCAGDGAIEESRTLARKLGISDRVSFTGWLDPHSIGTLLEQHELFALPSHAEGLPMALLEAMARGLAVIVTPVGGIPDVVKHMQNGCLVPAGDQAALAEALTTLLLNAKLRLMLGSSARRTVMEGFSIRAATERLERLYARYGIRPTPRQAAT